MYAGYGSYNQHPQNPQTTSPAGHSDEMNVNPATSAAPQYPAVYGQPTQGPYGYSQTSTAYTPFSPQSSTTADVLSPFSNESDWAEDFDPASGEPEGDTPPDVSEYGSDNPTFTTRKGIQYPLKRPDGRYNYYPQSIAKAKKYIEYLKDDNLPGSNTYVRDPYDGHQIKKMAILQWLVDNILVYDDRNGMGQWITNTAYKRRSRHMKP
jgi:hypothetical protein